MACRRADSIITVEILIMANVAFIGLVIKGHIFLDRDHHRKDFGSQYHEALVIKHDLKDGQL